MYPFLWYNNIMSEMIESKDLQQNSASFEELKKKSLAELRTLAKENGIKSITKYKKSCVYFGVVA